LFEDDLCPFVYMIDWAALVCWFSTEVAVMQSVSLFRSH